MIARWLRSTLSVALAMGLAACGAIDAYVYKPEEFNRNSPNFNKPPKDRDEVTICYNCIHTAHATVAELAQQECARFGKTARLEDPTFGNCPLLTPVEARFACVKPYAE